MERHPEFSTFVLDNASKIFAYYDCYWSITVKPLKDMTTDELINYVTGRLTLAIGRGSFSSEVALWVLSLQQLGAENAKRKRR